MAATEHADCSFDGSAVTCTCEEGHQGDGQTCDRVNPCDTNNGGCDANAACAFVEQDEDDEDCDDDATVGSVSHDDDEDGDDDYAVVCTCNEGFNGDDLTCAPVDPCTDVVCGTNATCDSTDGQCKCDEGYAGDPSVSCVGIP